MNPHAPQPPLFVCTETRAHTTANRTYKLAAIAQQANGHTVPATPLPDRSHLPNKDVQHEIRMQIVYEYARFCSAGRTRLSRGSKANFRAAIAQHNVSDKAVKKIITQWRHHMEEGTVRQHLACPYPNRKRSGTKTKVTTRILRAIMHINREFMGNFPTRNFGTS